MAGSKEPDDPRPAIVMRSLSPLQAADQEENRTARGKNVAVSRVNIAHKPAFQRRSRLESRRFHRLRELDLHVESCGRGLVPGR
jgi:hypothetical protein